jgi:hypothetical protein
MRVHPPALEFHIFGRRIYGYIVQYFYPVNDAGGLTLCFVNKAGLQIWLNLSNKPWPGIHIFLPSVANF